jgi:plasmid maintenance system antidote protein VapI
MRCATGISVAVSGSREIPKDESLKPLGLTANAPAKAIGVPPNRITAISEG